MAFRVPDECRRALEVFGLSGVAVAQPLFEVFGASPEVFVFADATNADIVAFALVLLLVPPLLLWGVGALVGLVRPTAREPVHLATLGLLTALLTVHLVKHQGLGPGLWLVPVGLLAAGALVVAYRRAPAVATLLRYLAFGPVVFLVGFLAFSPTGELMRPSGAEAARRLPDPSRRSQRAPEHHPCRRAPHGALPPPAAPAHALLAPGHRRALRGRREPA